MNKEKEVSTVLRPAQRDASAPRRVTADVVTRRAGDPLTEIFEDGSAPRTVVTGKSVASSEYLTVTLCEVSASHVRFAYRQTWHRAARVVVFRREGIGAGSDHRGNSDDGVRIDCGASAEGEVVDPSVEPGKHYYYTFEVRRPRSLETVAIEAKARLTFRRTPFHDGDYLYAGEAGSVGIQIRTDKERATSIEEFADHRTRVAGTAATFTSHQKTILKNQKEIRELGQTPEEELERYGQTKAFEAAKRKIDRAARRREEEEDEEEMRAALRAVDQDQTLSPSEKERMRRHVRNRFDRPAEEP